ncbi:MAG: adenine phosphoribosyltransferase [Ignavibacteria bacterium]|nr:adenine phosphoribosyltransferase [Ignavibacteria bacterium]
MDLKATIRSIKDFPKPGIMFRDITTLLENPSALNYSAGEIYNRVKHLGITKVAGIESRGFILGGIVASHLNAGFVLIRKPGKLPSAKYSEDYSLEYGTDSIEMHIDSIKKGDRVLLHDDLLATGGTAAAAIKLIEKAGGEVVSIQFIIELTFLPGREKLKGYAVDSLVAYDDEN